MLILIFKILAIYIVTAGAFIIWVFCSKQELVQKNFRTTAKILIRTAIVYSPLLLVCCTTNSDPLKVLIFILVLTLLTGGILYAGWGLMIYLAIAAWIIGNFPSEEFYCKPKPYQLPKDHSHLIGIKAISITPLKPGGKIQVDDNEFDAQSDLGFIEKGQEVIITGKKGFSLIVKQV